MEIRWNATDVKTSDDNSNKNENYLVWSKDNLSKGEKLTATVKYNKTAFSSLDSSKQRKLFEFSSTSSSSSGSIAFVAFIIIFIIIVAISASSSSSGYYRLVEDHT
jgi:hypothetical protein